MVGAGGSSGGCLNGSGVAGANDAGGGEARGGDPSGKNAKIAYVTISNGFGIYTINPGGGVKTKVTEGEQPSFSADGKKLVYVAYDGGQDTEIFTINLRWGIRFQVTHNKVDDWSPAFSPDGKRIVYWATDGTETSSPSTLPEAEGVGSK